MCSCIPPMFKDSVLAQNISSRFSFLEMKFIAFYQYVRRFICVFQSFLESSTACKKSFGTRCLVALASEAIVLAMSTTGVNHTDVSLTLQENKIQSAECSRYICITSDIMLHIL